MRAGRRPATDGGTEPVVGDEDPPDGADASGDETADADASPDSTAAPSSAEPAGSDPESGTGDAVEEGGEHRTGSKATGTRPDVAGEPTFETGPSSVGVALTVGASLVAVLPLAVAPAGLVVAVAGMVALGLSVRFDEPRAVGLGIFGLLGGAVLAGLLGAPPLAVLVATAGALLAWDVADRALVVGEQLGRAAPTARLELARATATALLLAVVAGIAYAVYRSAGGGKPMLALALLVLGATLLAAALR